MSSVTSTTSSETPEAVLLAMSKPVKTKAAHSKLELTVITYTAKKFAEMFLAEDNVCFAADTKIKILHIDPLLALNAKTAEISDVKYEALLEIFEEVLLLSGKTVISIGKIKKRDLGFSIEVGNNRSTSSITMHSRKPFSLQTQKGDLNTTASKLFNKMLFDNISSLTLAANQTLTFNEVPVNVITALNSLKKKPLMDIKTFLQINCPQDYTFNLRAANLQSNQLYECGTKFTISAQTGIKLEIIKTPAIQNIV